MQKPETDIAKLLVSHCAPLLAGMKVSHLLTTDRYAYGRIARLLCGTGIYVRPLYFSNRRITFFVYDEKALLQHLRVPQHAAFLLTQGYTSLSLPALFNEAALRFSAHKEGARPFPHELGILLGYPLQDVIGFMEHEGQDCLFSGYWKVYTLPAEKRYLFSVYDQARNRMYERLNDGAGIRDILHERALRKYPGALQTSA